MNDKTWVNIKLDFRNIYFCNVEVFYLSTNC